MQEAISHFNITESWQPRKIDLIEWFKTKSPNISENIIKFMATMIRLPEMQKGGYFTGNKKGNTQKR